MARNKPTPKPFFKARGDFLPSLERFVDAAVCLYQSANILTAGGADFPGKDNLRKAVEGFRAACLDDEED